MVDGGSNGPEWKERKWGIGGGKIGRRYSPI